MEHFILPRAPSLTHTLLEVLTAKMAPLRPVATKPSSFTQTTLNGSLIQRDSSSTTSMSGDTHRISKKAPKAQSKSPPKSAVSGASDRVSTDVLLSIKAVHLANIVTR